ncbi:MAG: CBS domain-containing protein [Polyangiaceae bacterium]
MDLPIRDFMTESPHSIGVNQPLAKAHEMMRAHRIRHLPVLRAGKLVGVLSQRDLFLVETLRDVDPASVPVEEAMTQNAYCVTPKTSLTRVADTMAEKKYGCAVVMEGGEVVGMFTATDALRALSKVTHRPTRTTRTRR